MMETKIVEEIVELIDNEAGETDEGLIQLGVSPSTIRFSSAQWAKPEQGRDILIAGAGGIGSWLTLFLSRIQSHRIHLIDFDKFEEVNLAGQFVENSSIGKVKSLATIESILKFVNSEYKSSLYGYEDKLTTDNVEDYVLPVTFSCFDNMEARKLLFESWEKLENREVFIDGRMVAEYYETYLVFKGREDRYKATLFSDSEGGGVACSYKATSHCGGMVAAEMVNLLNNYIVNSSGIIDIPFKKQYHMGLGGNYETEY